MTTAAGTTGPLAALRARDLNPVLVKEMRARFRGARAFVVLTVFLLLLTAVVALSAGMQSLFSSVGSGGGISNSEWAAQYGQVLFALLVSCEMFVVMLIGPALTMGTISGEVERQTYDLLLATPLSGWAILRGKVGAAMAYVLLLILSALPVMSLAFLFGGVSAVEVAMSQVSIFVSGLLFLMVGVFFSSLTQRTARSAVLSYITVGAVCVMPFAFVFVMGNILGIRGQAEALFFLQATPIASLASAMSVWSNSTQYLFWLQATILHVLTAALLYVVAGARLRRVGGGAVAAVLAIAVLFVLWFLFAVVVHVMRTAN